MTLQWQDKATLKCTWARSGAHRLPVPATHALIAHQSDAMTRVLVACGPCAEFIQHYQHEELGIALDIVDLADAPPIPAACPWMWRSHGCAHQGGHDGPHGCGCGDVPTERDELWEDDR